MIAWFSAGLVLAVAMIFIIRWLSSAEPVDVLKFLRWFALVFFIGAVAVLVISGRLALAFAFLPVLIPWIIRARWWLRMFKNIWRMSGASGRVGSGGAPGQTSEVDTRYLHMTLDHQSGEMEGRVLTGRFSGRGLDTMSLDELRDLYRDCAGDETSVQVLQSYLDRYHGESWRDGTETNRASSSGTPMTEDEAYRILGLEPGAPAKTIKDAYHRLMSKVHPDHGGSSYLAAQLNRAKELLLGD